MRLLRTENTPSQFEPHENRLRCEFIESPWFVYRIFPVRSALITDGPNENEARVIDQHFSYLEDLTEKQVVLLAGRTTRREPGGLAIVIFRAESEDEANQIMNNDPAFQNKVFQGDVLPFYVALLNAKALPA